MLVFFLNNNILLRSFTTGKLMQNAFWIAQKKKKKKRKEIHQKFSPIVYSLDI